MKKAHGSADYREQAKIYSKFLVFLNDLNDDKDHYRQCLWIIAFSKYKHKSFTDACIKLDSIKKSLELEENDLLGKNENLEQKILNIPSQL